MELRFLVNIYRVNLNADIALRANRQGRHWGSLRAAVRLSSGPPDECTRHIVDDSIDLGLDRLQTAQHSQSG